MSRRKRIGIDIDGVMYQWEKTARYMLREVLPNSPYPKGGPLSEESTHWNHIKEKIAPEHWKWLWTEGVRLGLFRHGHLYPGTIKAVRALAELGDLIVITHRPQSAVFDTLDWVSYQQLPISGIHILTNEEPKSGVTQCDVYIDDKPENCVDLSRGGALVCMPDRAWNRRSNFPNRIYSWNDFLNCVALTFATKEAACF